MNDTEALIRVLRALEVPPPGPEFRSELLAAMDCHPPMATIGRRRRRRRAAAAAVAIAASLFGFVQLSRSSPHPVTVAAIAPDVAVALTETESFSVTVDRRVVSMPSSGSAATFRGRLVLLASGDYWIENLEPTTEPGTILWGSFESATGVMRGAFIGPDGQVKHDLIVGQTDGGTGLSAVLGGSPLSLIDSVARMRGADSAIVNEVEVGGRPAWTFTEQTRMRGGFEQESLVEMAIDRETGLPLSVIEEVNTSEGSTRSITTLSDVVTPATLPPAFPGNVPPDIVSSGDADAVRQMTLERAVDEFGDGLLLPATPAGYRHPTVQVHRTEGWLVEDGFEVMTLDESVTITFRRGFRTITVTQGWSTVDDSVRRRPLTEADTEPTSVTWPIFERLVDGAWQREDPEQPAATEVKLRAGALAGHSATVVDGAAHVELGDATVDAQGDSARVVITVLESLRRSR